MSQTVAKLVAKRSKLKRTAKSILIIIALYADEDGGGAYPSVATIARDSGYTRRAVQAAKRAAVKAGELECIANYAPNKSGSDLYRVRLENLADEGSEVPTTGGVRRAPPVHRMRTRDLLLGRTIILLMLLRLNRSISLQDRPCGVGRSPKLEQKTKERERKQMAICPVQTAVGTSAGAIAVIT